MDPETEKQEKPQMDRQSKIKEAVLSGKDLINDAASNCYDAAVSFYHKLDGGSDFKDRHRSLELVIANASNETLEFDSEYFDAGTWFHHPEPLRLQPGDVTMLFVASNAGSLVTGVNGALKYRIASTDKCLFVGFSNPNIGSYKTYVAVDHQTQTARWAYERCEDDTVKVKPNDFGYQLTAKMRPPKQSPFKLIEYTIANV